MSKLVVGIVDYGVGNHASVRHTLHELELRCRISDDPLVLDTCDVLLLPGVGAFRPAIQALRARALDTYITLRANADRPLLGICLGMQLLASGSHEDGYEKGLGLIPGDVQSLRPPHWHIGWNTVEASHDDALFAASDGRTFYFNHSYAFDGTSEYVVATTRINATASFASAVRRGRIVGVQFHPEKSQHAGRSLLRQLIVGLSHA